MGSIMPYDWAPILRHHSRIAYTALPFCATRDLDAWCQTEVSTIKTDSLDIVMLFFARYMPAFDSVVGLYDDPANEY